jgi:DNA mismatch repair protein MLH1
VLCRLVDCPSLKRSIDAVFSEYLPKGSHPWVYLSLTLPGPALDVNVHPTKREVHFLHEDAIIQAVTDGISKQLLGSNSSRSFFTQTLLSQPSSSRGLRNAQAPAKSLGMTQDSVVERPAEEEEEEDEDEEDATQARRPTSISASAAPARRSSSSSSAVPSSMPPPSRSRASSSQGYPYKTVRTDASLQSIDRFVQRSSALQDELQGSTQAYDPVIQGTGPPRAKRVRPTEDIEELIRTAVPFGASDADPCCDMDGEFDGPEIDVDVACDEAGTVEGGGLRSAPTRRGVAAPVEQRTRTALREDAPPTQLQSVRELRAEVEDAIDRDLIRMVRKHKFVGVVDGELSLVQHDTKLLLVNHVALGRELFYQQALRLFGGMHSFELRPAPLVRDLLSMSLEREQGVAEEEREKITASVETLLLGKSSMLKEYFGVQLLRDDVRGGAVLLSLPRLVDGHTPQLAHLPEFITSLAYDVTWGDEKLCFQTVAVVLAELYSRVPLIPRFAEEPFEAPDPSSPSEAVHASTKVLRGEADALALHRRERGSAFWVVEHTLWPAFRLALTPTKALNVGHTVVQVACTEKLYRVFERC